MAQPIENAASERFERSTPEELNAYISELGIESDVPFRLTSDQKRRGLLTALGIEVRQNDVGSRPGPKIARSGEDIFPPYNLTAEGVWGGRRRRIKLPRPDGAKLENAMPFSFNGKALYYVAYDEVQNVPEPIYNLIVTNKKRRPVQIRTQTPEGATEITTGWEFDDVPMSDYGLDPETKDRAGSLMEWYQAKGPSWFEKRTLRELQLIAARCEVSMKGYDNKPLDLVEGLATIKTFFFGYPDAVEVKEAKEKAA
jgi:hypothetical protein